MDRLRTLFMIIGFITMVGMVVYPPWTRQDRSGHSQPMGYGFIWDPPERTVVTPALLSKWIDINVSELKEANVVDLQRLVTQELIVLASVGGVAIASKRRTQKAVL